MYYFWSKYEYEVVITTFPVYIDKNEIQKVNKEYEKEAKLTRVNPEVGIKIDIYEQLKLNWDKYVDYVYSFRKKGM